MAIPRSTLAQWVGACGVRLQPLVDALRETLLEHAVLHADETPVAMLEPGKGHTHRAYLWRRRSTQFEGVQAVVYDFANSRAAVDPKAFLAGWAGKLVCDDYSGYKALFAAGVTEVGCLAHARRNSTICGTTTKAYWPRKRRAVRCPRRCRAAGAGSSAEQRQRVRQSQSRPIADKLRGAAAAPTEGDRRYRDRQSDHYSLGRWDALTVSLTTVRCPSTTTGSSIASPDRTRTLEPPFAGSLRAGKRAAAVKS